MPELPEVETVVRSLRRGGLSGVTLRGARVSWPRSVHGMTPATFIRRLRGARIRRCRRRGKFIVLDLQDGRALLIHLRMTGHLRLALAEQPRDPHDRVAIALDDGRELRLRDTRKFGRVYLVAAAAGPLGRLGPEPLGARFTCAGFQASLRLRGRRLKPLLLDQAFLAGLGNIYVDEALWEAGLHPLRRASALAPAEARRLFVAIRCVLRRGIRNRGTSLGTGRTNFAAADGRFGRNQQQVRVFRRTGRPCPRCGTPIRRLIVGQRSTHICPVCQPRG